jgi:hypothetical protein
MNDRKTNELTDKEVELAAMGTLSDKELQSKRYNGKPKNSKKSERMYKSFTYRDLSGGLLGI